MKLKELETCLQDLEGFRAPRIDLEQYETQPHLAARTLFSIEQSYGDIDGKIVADLGCGPGRLSIGASFLGADICYGFDVDPNIADIFHENCSMAEVDNVECILQDVTNFRPGIPNRFEKFFDTVILNPPFGTKNNKGIDVSFLLAALVLSKKSVYSFHKSATREFFLRKAKDWNVQIEVVAELRFDLPQTFKRHTRESVDVRVDLLRTVHR